MGLLLSGHRRETELAVQFNRWIPNVNILVRAMLFVPLCSGLRKSTFAIVII